MHIATNFPTVDWWLYALSEYVIHPFIMIILCLLSVFVVLGNMLVVSAIWHENQLHSVTNYLIASLAAADCLVGLVVMPFSVISETIIGSWTFGPTWCDLWHSFDVLASTASILNLCAISFDRYLAITNPISYPTRMTPRRVAFIVIFLWTCSSLISFPAILWWRAVGEPLQLLPPSKLPSSQRIFEETSISSTSSSSEANPRGSGQNLEIEIYKCVFTDDTYYLLFSSIISFYGPAGIMLYAYYKIYKAAVKQTRFLKLGSKQVVIGGNKKSRRNKLLSENLNYGSRETGVLTEMSCDKASTVDAYDKQLLVLRAHRGGMKSTSSSCNQTTTSLAEQTDLNKCSPNNRKKHDGHSQSETKDLKSCPIASPSKDSFKSALSKNEAFSSSSRNEIANRNRFERLSFANSKKDKLRIYSQRFDSNPREIKDQTKQDGSRDLDDHNSVYSKTTDELYKTGRSTRGNENLDSNQITVNKPNTKPLLASLSGQSTGVDVSVINHYKPFEDIDDNCGPSNNATATCNVSLVSGSRGTNTNLVTTDRAEKLINLENSCLESITDESDSDEEHNDEDDSNESGSSSSNETYGTGSIASVLMRPRVNQKDPIENNLVTRGCCDSGGDQFGNIRMMRRTLSVGEPRAFELRQCQSELANPVTRSSDIKGISIRGGRVSKFHRSSCGNAAFAQGSNEIGTSTVKATNFRSWVRFKPNVRKNDQIRQELTIRTPRSLRPLMMMNSDTSTDSSTVASVVKNDEVFRKYEAGQVPQVHSIEIKASLSNQLNRVHSLVAVSNSKRNNCSAVQHQRSESDLDRRDCNSKRQILYYDSDRLIQSLVDLTAIHYIDCANQAGTDTQDTIVKVTKTLDSQSVARELSEKTQSYEHDRTNTPRQQRTVGKKLSKLAKERKAAKTLGIVVGVFILCWLPFFVVNIVVALCGTNCIYKFEVFVAIVTWLGWLNSAMNPVIYACWSRDFRRAFKRVLCSWIEFICPYNGGNLARKLRLKKASKFPKKDYFSRNVSSVKGPTSSTVRSGVSLNGSISRSLISDQ